MSPNALIPVCVFFFSWETIKQGTIYSSAVDALNKQTKTCGSWTWIITGIEATIFLIFLCFEQQCVWMWWNSILSKQITMYSKINPIAGQTYTAFPLILEAMVCFQVRDKHYYVLLLHFCFSFMHPSGTHFDRQKFIAGNFKANKYTN